MEGTEAFLADIGADPRMLGHMDIVIDAPQGAAGEIASVPQVVEDRLYYPAISLAINQIKPNIEGLNRTFRHELGHAMQESGDACAYLEQRARNLMRMLGGVASYEMLDTLATRPPGSMLGWMCLGAAAYYAANVYATPGTIMHVLNR